MELWDLRFRVHSLRLCAVFVQMLNFLAVVAERLGVSLGGPEGLNRKYIHNHYKHIMI